MVAAFRECVSSSRRESLVPAEVSCPRKRLQHGGHGGKTIECAVYSVSIRARKHASVTPVSSVLRSLLELWNLVGILVNAPNAKTRCR